MRELDIQEVDEVSGGTAALAVIVPTLMIDIGAISLIYMMYDNAMSRNAEGYCPTPTGYSGGGNGGTGSGGSGPGGGGAGDS